VPALNRNSRGQVARNPGVDCNTIEMESDNVAQQRVTQHHLLLVGIEKVVIAAFGGGQQAG